MGTKPLPYRTNCFCSYPRGLTYPPQYKEQPRSMPSYTYAVKEHHLDKQKKYTDKVLMSSKTKQRERERDNIIRERTKKAAHRRQGISKHVLHCSRHSKEGTYWHLSRHLDSDGKTMAPTMKRILRKNFSILLFFAQKKNEARSRF
jgi:hypothetical protein